MNFSVCIPTYNRPAGLVRALNSFHNQTYDKAFEIILIITDLGEEFSFFS